MRYEFPNWRESITQLYRFQNGIGSIYPLANAATLSLSSILSSALLLTLLFFFMHLLPWLGGLVGGGGGGTPA
jgi:hypothetical protein